MQVNATKSNTHQQLPGEPVSKRLEAAFLEEMLKYILPKTESSDFSGGIGEQQFKSFLVQEYASAISTKLDLGLLVKDSPHAQ